MAYINVLGKLRTTGYEGLADATQIAYSTKLDEDDDTVMDESIKDVIDAQSESIADLDGKVESFKTALDAAIIDGEVTPEAVASLSQKVTDMGTQINNLFVVLSQDEYDALDTYQNGVLYLIKQNPNE